MMKEVVMPRVGMQIMVAVVGKWLKDVGDTVEEREPLFIVSSAMGNIEIRSLFSGQLVKIFVGEQEKAEVGSVIALIE